MSNADIPGAPRSNRARDTALARLDVMRLLHASPHALLYLVISPTSRLSLLRFCVKAIAAIARS